VLGRVGHELVIEHLEKISCRAPVAPQEQDTVSTSSWINLDRWLFRP
jgi:hypothetical protein